jgi:hypothetical protein
MTERLLSKKNYLKKLGIGAAAIGGLFACNQADADIVNSGAGNGFSFSGAAGFNSGSVDFDNNGNPDIIFYAIGGPGNMGFAINDNNLYSVGGMAIGGTTGGFYFPTQFAAGASIGTGGQSFGPFIGWQGYRIGATSVSTDPWGVFANGTATGFIGFQFYGVTAGSGIGLMNGWVQVALDSNTFTYSVLDWAYENMGNTIQAGDTGNAIPEPSGLALAALAAGAVSLRRRRKAA